MKNFVNFVGVDGHNRAVSMDDVRLLEDDNDHVIITLCDGTQFSVVGTVENILLTQRSHK